MQPNTPEDTAASVLIVGGGPTGLVTSILLARYGIRTTVVDRHKTVLSQPKAHGINPRSLEIFRQIGLDTQRLRVAGAMPKDVANVSFATSMAGLELGSLPYERQGEDAKSITPEPLFNIPQPNLQEFLAEAASASELVAIRKPYQWQSLKPTTDGKLVSTIINRSSNREQELSADYVLFCDGANSQSRAKLGVTFSPLPGQSKKPLHHVSVHMRGDFSQFNPATLIFVISPKSTGTFICYERRSSWVFVFNYDPEELTADQFKEDYCRSLIDQAIGDTVPYDVLSITLWSTFPRIAEDYQCKSHKQAFFLGDAAHAFPPTGGLGVNTGIADAHNLVWKLHAVVSGQASEGLLETYASERRPVAVANALQSTKNQEKLMVLLKASQYLDSEHPEQSFKDAAVRAKIARAIMENEEHFDSINLQLGYIYGAETTGPCNIYRPSSVPGARLPHAAVRVNGHSCSTLDLIDGHSFVVLAPEGFLESLGGSFRVPQVGVVVTILRANDDFIVEDPTWCSLMKLDTGASAVLVRPDQHILDSIATEADIISCLVKFLLG